MDGDGSKNRSKNGAEHDLKSQDRSYRHSNRKSSSLRDEIKDDQEYIIKDNQQIPRFGFSRALPSLNEEKGFPSSQVQHPD